MSEKICIVTDSCSDIPDSLLEKYEIRMIPMIIRSSKQEYKDRVNICAKDVYKLLENEILKSACPMGEDMLNALEQAKEEGFTHVIAIMLSGGLSGTYNAMRLWSDNVDGLEVAVFDSRNGSIGCGIIAIQAAKYIQEGYSFAQLTDLLPKLIENTYVYFSIEHLDLLEKGGRIGKATSLIGSVMKIHPILSFDKEGELYSPAKVRGKAKIASKFVSLVEKLVENHPGKPFNLLIADGDDKEGLVLVREKMKEAFPNFRDFVEAEIGATLSCYIGDEILGAGIQFLEE
ncbi:MAG: DegV family protein [Bacillota bacterium]|nr:DegV family protein [Bacillota bacterium]